MDYLPLPGAIYIWWNMKKMYIKSDFKAIFFKPATNGQSDKGFLLTSTFVPKGLSAPALGLYTCIKALKYPGLGVRWAFTEPLILKLKEYSVNFQLLLSLVCLEVWGNRFLAHQTRFSTIFTSADKSYLTHPNPTHGIDQKRISVGCQYIGCIGGHITLLLRHWDLMSVRHHIRRQLLIWQTSTYRNVTC